MTSQVPALEFTLPPELEAGEPPEVRGLQRDSVRLMVSHYSNENAFETSISNDAIAHAHFYDLPEFLSLGDLIVINTSRTRNAALYVTGQDSIPLIIHLSSHLDKNLWSLEVRSMDRTGKTGHFDGVKAKDTLHLPEGGAAILREPYISDCYPEASPSKILWVAELSLPSPVNEYLAHNGFPIRYNYVKDSWPLDFYQTVYASDSLFESAPENRSSEMPSAGRPFTLELIKQLTSKGIPMAPLILHTGVSNLETHEPPYREYYSISQETARMINYTRGSGHRIVAVGTTVVRALETQTGADGITHAGEGWTCLVITPRRNLRSINTLITGMHEPGSSHLDISVALAGFKHIERAYKEALKQRYLWHEFGDLHLLMQ